MPRIKIIKDNIYRGYSINPKYQYNQQQLDKVIEALEYYHDLSITNKEQYVVFEATLNVNEAFNPNDLKNVLPTNHFWYRWTREYKKDYGVGLHYHLMVIALAFPVKEWYPLQEKLESIDHIRTVYIAPRMKSKDFATAKGKLHYHYLDQRGEDGLDDAVTRHCYISKLDQKLDKDKRTFDGCRKLTPLLPVSDMKYYKYFVKVKSND